MRRRLGRQDQESHARGRRAGDPRNSGRDVISSIGCRIAGARRARHRAPKHGTGGERARWVGWGCCAGAGAGACRPRFTVHIACRLPFVGGTNCVPHSVFDGNGGRRACQRRPADSRRHVERLLVLSGVQGRTAASARAAHDHADGPLPRGACTGRALGSLGHCPCRLAPAGVHRSVECLCML